MPNPMENQTSAASSSSSASTSYRNFDVFINHRGPDVKDTFAAHLYHRLRYHGLQVFLDKPELLAGEEFPRQIEGAIQVSSVHVAIFSPTYAESKWCLDELTLMVESRKRAESRVTILPVFYKVKPSELKRRAGSYAKALRYHRQKTTEDPETGEVKARYQLSTIQKWRSALFYAADISGFELNGDEEEFLNKVVEAVLKKVPKPLLEVAKYPTGVDDKLQDFERTMSQWHEQQVKAKVVGVVGFGGIGKTTLAKAFFNSKRSVYRESSFLFEVRETSKRKSVSYLQKKLIKDLKHTNDIKIDSPDEGKGILKQYLSHCHALIIIDDVDHAHQLDGLLPMKDILHPESLILVTTRDKHVLEESRVPLIYNLRGLNPLHSTELFCSYAFFQPLPPPEFQELVDRFVTACDGLPLSLKVIGALLCGKNEIYWKEQFDLLRQSLPEEIEKRIRISYDSLTGRDQKIFLDIACFFLGEETDRAVRIWGQVGIRNLEDKCLLEVDSRNKIRMHDHIRDSARNIAKEGCMPPRIWHGTTHSIDALLELSPSAITEVRGITTVGDFYPRNLHREILHLTSAITEVRGIMLSKSREILDPTSVNNYISKMSKKKNYSHIHVMSNLQLVATEGSYLEGILRMVRSPPIIWLRWMKCSESSLPGWIPRENLKVLELQGDMLEILWPHHSQGPLGLLELTIVAPRLSEFPKSIGKLKHLQWISVNDVDSLQWAGLVETLPQEFCELCSLKHLTLKHLRLVSLPDLFGKLTNLEYLDLGGASSLQTLPNSFGDLIRLKHLSLGDCSSLTISKGALGNITTLEYLYLHGCRNVKELPLQVSHQRFLEKLYLQETSLKELPSDIGALCSLEVLEIGGNSLEVLPPSFGCFLPSLKYFKAYNSPKLKCLPDSFGLLTQLTELSLVGCGIEYLPEGLLKLNNLEGLNVRSCPLQELPFEADTILLGCRKPWNKLHSANDKCMFGLTRLQLFQTNISEVTFPEGVCPNLQLVILVGNAELMQIRGLCGLSKLDKLCIDSCVKVDIVNLETLTSLRQVSVVSCWKLKSIQALAQLTKLVGLEVSGCHEIGSLEGVEHCLSLGALDVTDCPKLKSIPWLGQLTKLRSLKVYRCPEIVKLPSVEHCLEVEQLEVVGCPKLKSILGLGRLKELRRLYVVDCHGIVGLPGVEHCMSLKFLKVVDCPKLKSIPVSGQLTKLETLTVSGCHEIVGLGVEHCLSLQYLKVRDCPKLKSMPGCVEDCMSLQYLEVRDCPKLKSIPWLGQLTKLGWLMVSGCHEIVGLPGVEDCMSLQDLDARDCPQLQWGGGVLQQLRRRLGHNLKIDVKQYKRRKFCTDLS